jgi:Excalibur calcium-binding domain
MRRIALLLAAAIVLALTAAPAAFAQVNDQDCKDFASQAEAQAHLNADPSDPDNLDADNDGKACESFNYGSNGGTQPANANNGETLATTGPTSSELPLGAGLVAAGILLVAVTARRYQGRHARR